MTDRGELPGYERYACARDVHHAAGLAGYASSFYIDSVIIEDANLSGDAALEARRYLLQIWRTLPVSKSCR